MVRKRARNSSKSSDKTKTESPKRTTRSGRNSRWRRGSASESEDENRDINESESTSAIAKHDNESINIENSSVCEDEGETEEKNHKGKSKTKSKSNTETSSQNERDIENENVQVTPESPPNDYADNESVVQNVTEIVNDDHTEERPVERDYQGDSVQEMPAVNTDSTYNDTPVNANENEGETHLEQQTEIASESVAPETEQIETVASDENGDRSHTPPPIDTRKEHEHRENTPEKLLHDRRSSSCNETDQHDKSNSSKPSGKRISLRRMHHEVNKATGEKDKEVRESEGSTRRKITLRRSHGYDTSVSVKENTGTEDASSTTPEKKLLEVEAEKNGDSNSASQQDDSGWASTYEKASNKEGGQIMEKPSRRISLKRKSVVDEHTSSSSHNVNSEEPNLYIEDHSQRRRHSSASERTDSIDKPQKPFRKIKIIRNLSLNDNTEDNPEGEAIEKQPKSRNTRWISEAAIYVPKVDMELLKTVCSNLQFPSENEVNLESTPPPSRRVSVNFGGSAEQKGSAESDAESEKSYGEPQKSEDEESEQTKIETNPSIIALNRKISIVDDTASKMRPPPSPPRNPVSDVLFITNLVRPFTVKQLKELLERTGTIKSDGFWTDRIKSKCFVRYELPEEAEATRNALHGVNWPIGNGKKLMIDYATVEEMEKARCPPVVIPAKKEKTPEKENRKPDLVGARDPREPVERKRDEHIREWDAGKEDYHNRRRSRTRSRSRERIRKHIRRSYTPEGDYYPKKRRHDDPAPQKLMDDLFLKTKATPSIYWQPLSPEEIAMKQQQRLVRMEEHKRRLEETRGRRDTTFRGSTFRRR